MKKLLIIVFMIICMPVFADTMPFYSGSIPQEALGLYQTDDIVKIYSHPDSNSVELAEYKLTYKPETMPDNVFALLLNDKKLGFLYATDIEEDGWVEVIYDKRGNRKGWVKTSDNMQFLPWMNFYNLYGRKYGLRMMKDAPKDLYALKSQSEDVSQTISKLNYIQKMKLTKISGNWALVTVFDLDKTPKSGWLKWRSSDGKIYAFPDIKQ